MTVRLVYDGGDEVRVPPEMGTPRDDQMQGSPLERLGELCGRCCYDSVGTPKSRSSSDYHRHILEVGHLSVYRHCNATFVAPFSDEAIVMRAIINRPGVFAKLDPVLDDCLLTVNVEALLQWSRKWSVKRAWNRSEWNEWASAALATVAPGVGLAADGADAVSAFGDAEVVTPETDEEKWVSVYIRCSRSCSHELVKHHWQAAVSQRSTRYCDESESKFVPHPAERTSPAPICDFLPGCADDYGYAVDTFSPQYGRKQARAAAARYLPHGLETELIFSASVAEWREFLRQRGTDWADAEIRQVAADALAVLQSSRYADCFAGYTLTPAADGLGMCVTNKETVQ